MLKGGFTAPLYSWCLKNLKSKNKGAAMGVMLGSQSFGYAISLSLSYIITTNYGYKISFLTASLISLVGAVFLLTAVYEDFLKKYKFSELNKKFSLNQNTKNKIFNNRIYCSCYRTIWSVVLAASFFKCYNCKQSIYHYCRRWYYYWVCNSFIWRFLFCNCRISF